MDDKSKLDRQEEQSEERKINESVNKDAGPSGVSLPGSAQSPKTRSGLSKSEYNIRQIITTQDVTNALKSLSYGNPTQAIKNINLQDPKISAEDDKNANDLAALLDVKKFMASCFKLNKENPVISSEIPLQSIHTTLGSLPNQVETNANCNVQTECLPLQTPDNEVIVTNIDLKVSKVKKKTSGNLSGRSEVGQKDSLSSIGSNVCRICMTRGRERLISPCNCKGSLANVHLSCLERWLNQVGRNHCELCGFSYPAIRTPRYTVLQALRLWFGNPRNRGHLQVCTNCFVREPTHTTYQPQSDCLIFWLLSTVTAGLLAVCIVGTQYFVIEGNKFGKLDAALRKEEGISHRITETAMDFFMAIVLCGYSVTVYLLWKDHYVMWNRWRRANVNVRLLLAPDNNPVPFEPGPRYNIV